MTYEQIIRTFYAATTEQRSSARWVIGFRTAVEIKDLALKEQWDGTLLLGAPVDLVVGEGLAFS